MDSKQQRILAREQRQRQPAVDVACVIHGNGYDWTYVERLHSMVTRNCNRAINFHVFTEHDRPVPMNMTKHILTDWPGVTGRKRSWWYKMQMFNPEHFQGQLLYFDLDVVITGSLDWIFQMDPAYFWGIRDFRWLWRNRWTGINSSMMWWDTVRWAKIWHDFNGRSLATVMRQFAGDQDFLSNSIPTADLRYFDPDLVKSWRWEIKDGGLDMKTRIYRRPSAGSVLLPQTRVMVFHGNPKPHQITDPVIAQHWI